MTRYSTYMPCCLCHLQCYTLVVTWFRITCYATAMCASHSMRLSRGIDILDMVKDSFRGHHQEHSRMLFPIPGWIRSPRCRKRYMTPAQLRPATMENGTLAGGIGLGFDCGAVRGGKGCARGVSGCLGGLAEDE